ncbi:MAG: SIR2 family protein [Acidimicrobiales bacterium]
MTIPDPPAELVRLVSERKVIPFVGAGASAHFKFPTWWMLLESIARDVCPETTFADLKNYANNDPLQVAEFLFLKSYQTMGPIRHIIERELPSNVDYLTSGLHVELANLGAPQIYTTNYDEAIEGTLRKLDLPVNVVTLPRDIATADHELTQVVKYHGDLRHDETLVLTESSYYRRLDFESPMDLKFRADLLGRSVLFMGYSFSDVNIRVIWFKLMAMMKGIPAEDRPQSYIVRPHSNPVLEALDRSVGLNTIVLDPTGTIPEEGWTVLLAEFLFRLGAAASPSGTIPGRPGDPMYVSSFVLDEAQREANVKPQFSFVEQSTPTSFLALRTRSMPRDLYPRARQLLHTLITSQSRFRNLAVIGSLISIFGVDDSSAKFLRAQLLTEGGRDWIADFSEDNELDWAMIWSVPVELSAILSFVTRAHDELNGHRHGGYSDDDLFFVADVLVRFVRDQLTVLENDGAAEADVKLRAQAALDEIAETYPDVLRYVPNTAAMPDISTMRSDTEVAIDYDGVSD